MKLKSLFLLSTILLSNIFRCAEAAEEISFRNHQIPGSNIVFCFAQDDDGLIWIGTLNHGLYCYNGYKSYPRAQKLGSSIKAVYDLSISGDSIYMACDKGISIFNRRTLISKYLQQPQMTNARAIVKYKDDFYIGSDQGLFRYSPVNGKVELVNKDVTNIFSIVPSHKGLLVGSLYGLYLINGKSCHEIPVDGERKAFISAVMADRNEKNKFWIGAFGRFFSYKVNTNTFTEEVSLRDISVKTLAQDKNGDIYIGTDNGLYVKSGSNISHLSHDYKDAHTIPNNIVWRTFVDRNENLWLGTDYGFSISGTHSCFKYLSVFQMTGLSTGNYIESVFEDSKHTLWIGGSSGLLRYPADGNWTWYRHGDSHYPIAHNRVRSFFEDKDHNMWISTDLGINLYISSTRQLRNLTVTDRNHHYTARWAYDMTEDNRGNLWIASYNGIYVISKERLLRSNGEEIEADKVFMPETHFTHILLDNKEQVWTTSSQGLMCINTTNYSVHSVTKDPVSVMTMIDHSDIWVASNGRFLHFSGDGKLKDELKYGTSKDEILTMTCVGDELWAVSQHEYRIIKKSHEIEVYKIPYFSATSGSYSSNTKRFYIGSIDGLLVFDPKKMNGTKRDNPQLVLSEILVNGEQLSNQPEKILDKTIKLSYDENNIVFMFSDLPYLNRMQRLYAYTLDGVDNGWQPLNSGTYEASYNGLPYGDYTLRVCTIDGFGNVEDGVFALDVCILPPWYLTWWMKIVYTIMIAGLAYCALHYYMVKRRLRQEREAKVKIMEESKARISYYQNIYSDIRVALGSIMRPMHQMLSTHPKNESLHLLEEMRHESTRLNSLIREASEVNTSDKPAQCHEEPLDIVEICHQMVEETKQEGAKRGLKFTFSSFASHLYEAFDITEANSLYSILLGYVIQHSNEGGLIDFSISNVSSNQTLKIVIKSNTMHIPNDIRPYLFQRYALQMPDSPEDYTPMLYLTNEYVEKYNGTIDVIQAEDGDAFVITFPISMQNAIKETETLQSDNRDAASTKRNAEEKSTGNSESDERLLLEVISLIGEHMSDSEFNVSKLQQALGIGDKMLYRKIKHMTGLTPVEYIRDIRMKRASILLRDGQFSVSEVMYMIGFSNTGYFSKCFSHAFGMTPTQYIHSKNNGNDD